MAVGLMRLAWLVEWPSHPMRGVALKLCDAANDEGENIYPSVGRIERETGWSASAVRQAIAAMEEAGLLEVVAEAKGNRWGRSTTVRRMRVDLLARLSTIDHHDGAFSPSATVLKRIEAGGKTRWAMVLRGRDDASAYDVLRPPPVAPAPLHGVEGGAPGGGGVPDPGCTRAPPGGGGGPSMAWRVPLHGVDPNHHRTTSEEDTPLPPSRGAGEKSAVFDVDGRRESAPQSPFASLARRWAKALPYLRSVLDGDGAGLGEAAVVRAVILANGGLLGPPKGANAGAYARQMTGQLRGFDGKLLARLGAQVGRERKHNMPPVYELERDARSLARTLAFEAAVEAQAVEAAAAVGDPVKAEAWNAAWDGARRALETVIGTDKVNAWFRSIVVGSLADGTLTLVVPAAFIRSWIDRNYSADVLAVAKVAFLPADVQRVVLRVAAPGGAPAREVAGPEAPGPEARGATP